MFGQYVMEVMKPIPADDSAFFFFFFFWMKKIQGKPETKKSYNKERKTTAGRTKQQQLRAATLQDNMLHKAWTHTFPNLRNT